MRQGIERRAVVDVGSNSVLLTVCERTPDGWHETEWSSEVTGLGTDTKKTGLLSQDAQERTLAAIARAVAKAKGHGAECVAAATMAVRIATNASEFLDRAQKQGTPVVVISGEDEAQLGLEAVMRDPTFQSHQRVSVIDPGGHSTELTTAQRTPDGFEVVFRKSFPIGALGLRETTLGADAPDRAARLRAVVEIDDLLAMQYLPHQAGTAIALGATPTNLVSIRNAQSGGTDVHGQYLDYEEVSKSAAWLSDMPEAERSRVPGLEPGREKTLHIGALILERFLNSIHVLGCHVSTRGWRHALLGKDVYFC
jgi:exopolyphosphatase/guanosine-5'-triphosphate,3'-diphosphate pyrophosphatase